MANAEGESLESLLNRATNPSNRNDDWEFIMDFCDRVNSELEGVRTATKLLLHKVRSPQEREALQAITVLEACVKNCGELFQNAIGRSSFINEVFTQIREEHVKKKQSPLVQQNLIKLVYVWSVALPDQKNIVEGYRKLKHQGIITSDPDCDAGAIATLQQIKAKEDIFSASKEKKVQLEKLLKSKNPHDIKAANLLIKSVIQEDEEKMEREQKNLATLEEVKNNASLLNEMLAHFKPGLSVQADVEIMKVVSSAKEKQRAKLGARLDSVIQEQLRNVRKKIELYSSCANFRTILYGTAASSSDEKTVAEILRTNDQVTEVMKAFEKITKKKSPVSPQKKTRENFVAKKTPMDSSDSALIDISAASSSDFNSIGALSSIASTSHHSASTILKDADDTLLDLRGSPSTLSNHSTCLLDDLARPSSSKSYDLDFLLNPQTEPQVEKGTDLLCDDLLGLELNPKSYATPNEQNGIKTASVNDPFSTLIDLNTAEPYTVPISSKPNLPTNGSTRLQNTSLDNVHVLLELIRPSSFPSITMYDKNNIRVLIHFAKDHATPSRTDTLVAVLILISTNIEPVSNITLQVAAPKNMEVKLQAAPNNELPPFNPITSIPPMTKVMVISNPQKVDVKLRYKLEYTINKQPPVSEMGIIGGFPPPEKWGKL